MIHPVPYDMGMMIRHPDFPASRVFFKVPFVPVNVNLDGPYAPPLLNGGSEFLEVIQRCPFFDNCHSLSERAASFTDTLYAFLVRIFYIFLLHCSAGLFLNHCLERFIVFLKASELQLW